MTYRNLSALFFSFIISYSVLAANQVTIVSDSKSDYQIVIPDKGKIPWMDDFIEESAKLMQSAIAEAGEAVLPVVEESKLLSGKPCIYLGSTDKSKNMGIDTDKLDSYEYILKSIGKDIFILGKDLAGPAALKWPNKYFAYELGTVKAITSFLENYVGTRFVMPGPNGVSVEKKTLIEVPDNLNIKKSPFFKYCIGRYSNDIFYELANNFYPSIKYGSYGGHSHSAAITQDKYFKEHPEYFALINGKRYTSDSKPKPQPQYCLSNLEFQELVYKELLRKLDEGYDYAQLAQGDGFKGCECDKCKNLYWVNDFCEKLWIMHKIMAERLLKDRPGKKVMILSYGPTSYLPKTFKDFPENVMIELCLYSPEDFENWKKYKVPGGFTSYIYNWGSYNTEGFTPKRTPEFCKEQIDLFRKNNVWGIYRCGFGELYGLEGPVYYTYGKLLEDTGVASDKLVDEYCESAFRDSSDSMKPFFYLLHDRLKIQLDHPDLHGGRRPGGREAYSVKGEDVKDGNIKVESVKRGDDSIRILQLRYPSDVMNKLEIYLREAEKTAKEKKEIARLKIVRIEFDYLMKTALIAELFDSCNKSPSKELSVKLIKAIDARNKFIGNLPKKGKTEPFVLPCEGCGLFSRVPVQKLMAGGISRGLLKVPYMWLTPGTQEIKVPRTETPVKIDGTADETVWSKAEKEHLLSIYMGKDIELPKTTVQASYDDKALYVLLRTNKAYPKKSKKENMTNSFYVFLENSKSMETLYMFTARATDKTARIYKHFSAVNIGATNEFKTCPEIKEKIDFACVIDEKAGTMNAEFRIPFSIYGKAPDKGDNWYGNFLWKITNAEKTDSFWEPNISVKTWNNRHRYDIIGLDFQ